MGAQFNMSATVITVLIEAGANVAAKDAFRREPLHMAARYNPSADVAMALDAAGANVNSLVSHGLKNGTPLHFACLFNPSIVSALLEAGAWVNILNIFDESPLFFWPPRKITQMQFLPSLLMGQIWSWAKILSWIQV